MCNNTLSRPGNARRTILRVVQALLLGLCLCLPAPAPAAGKKLVLLPLAMYADPSKSYLRQGLRSMFLSRLSGEGVDLISEEALTPLLDEKDRQGVTSGKRAEDLARRLGADYAVFGSITAMGGYSLDLNILEFKEGEAKVTRVSETAEEDQFIPKLGEVVNQFRAVMEGIDIEAQRMAKLRAMTPQGRSGGKGIFFSPSTESRGLKPTGRVSIRVAVMGLDTGDLDGDGTQELVVLARDRLMVYSRAEEKAVLKSVFKPSRGEEFLKVSVGDMDRNGKMEIYLVSLYGERAQSAILEWSGNFTQLLKQPGHLQVVRTDRGRPMLLFQDSQFNEFFSGGISLMTYERGGGLRQIQALSGLKEAQFYTLAAVDINGDGSTEFLGLGPADLGDQARIHLWDMAGNVLWQSRGTFGGTNNVIRVGMDPNKGPGDLAPRVVLNSRLVVTDVDDDGKKDLLLIRNVPLSQSTIDLDLYVRSKIVAYKIERASLVQSWVSTTLNYCLTDIQTEGETVFIAAQKGKMSNIGSGSGRIMWFE